MRVEAPPVFFGVLDPLVPRRKALQTLVDDQPPSGLLRFSAGGAGWAPLRLSASPQVAGPFTHALGVIIVLRIGDSIQAVQRYL